MLLLAKTNSTYNIDLVLVSAVKHTLALAAITKHPPDLRLFLEVPIWDPFAIPIRVSHIFIYIIIIIIFDVAVTFTREH